MKTHAPASLPVGSLLSSLWLFAILNVLFRDVHEMAEASTIEGILAGTMNGRPVTEEALFFGAFAVEILIAMTLLSRLARPSVARWLNLLAAPAAALGVLAFAPNDPDDVVFAAFQIGAFATIFVVASRWRTGVTAGARRTARASSGTA